MRRTSITPLRDHGFIAKISKFSVQKRSEEALAQAKKQYPDAPGFILRYNDHRTVDGAARVQLYVYVMRSKNADGTSCTIHYPNVRGFKQVPLGVRRAFGYETIAHAMGSYIARKRSLMCIVQQQYDDAQERMRIMQALTDVSTKEIIYDENMLSSTDEEDLLAEEKGLISSV